MSIGDAYPTEQLKMKLLAMWHIYPRFRRQAKRQEASAYQGTGEARERYFRARTAYRIR